MSEQRNGMSGNMFMFIIIMIVIAAFGVAALTESEFMGGAFLFGGFYVLNKIGS